MKKSLYEFLEEVPDHRRGQGMRFPLSAVLVMSIMSCMSGRTGINNGAAFMKGNSPTFVALLGLKHGVPGATHYNTLLKGIDYASLSDRFYAWCTQFVEMTPGEWCQIDGKALGSTVKEQHSSKQSFDALVTLFCTKLGVAFTCRHYDNGKKSEIHVAQEMIEQLAQKGVVLTLDAVHCQKKQQN
jgi:DDE_Tnp_1-associated